MTTIFYNQPKELNEVFMTEFTKTLKAAITKRNSLNNIVTHPLAIEFEDNRIIIDTVDAFDDDMITIVAFDEGAFDLRLSFDKFAESWVYDFVKELNDTCKDHFVVSLQA